MMTERPRIRCVGYRSIISAGCSLPESTFCLPSQKSAGCSPKGSIPGASCAKSASRMSPIMKSIRRRIRGSNVLIKAALDLDGHLLSPWPDIAKSLTGQQAPINPYSQRALLESKKAAAKAKAKPKPKAGPKAKAKGKAKATPKAKAKSRARVDTVYNIERKKCAVPCTHACPKNVFIHSYTSR